MGFTWTFPEMKSTNNIFICTIIMRKKWDNKKSLDWYIYLSIGNPPLSSVSDVTIFRYHYFKFVTITGYSSWLASQLVCFALLVTVGH